MQVISFTATLPGKLLNDSRRDTNNKYLTLIKFIQGVNAVGDAGTVIDTAVYQPCDVAVMLGWAHEHGKQAPHLSFRQEVIDQQQRRGGRVVIADSNLFLYADTKNPNYYLRYSFDGVFPDTGEYCDSDPDPVRWSQIQKTMGLDLKPWRDHGSHILMCLQRDGGWSMAGFSVVDWALITAKQIRQYSQRPIRIRPHPGDNKAGRYCREIMTLCQRHSIANVSLSSPEHSLVMDFNHCWAVVVHNSSPGVAAVIEGIPVFVTDPGRSQARAVANRDISRIEEPEMFDREAWIQRLAQFHWNFSEITDGTAWRHMRAWAKKP